MQEFTVMTPFWHAGRLRMVGEIVQLSQEAAKYRGAEIAPVAVAEPAPKSKRREKAPPPSAAPEGAE
ncbi:hypothetical protein PUH89_04070 [Rhodobacter capsulatus]|uniref:Uncharacterized protein n=1 Tax=Rhodobacter capsulatus TaxID=1061 RepID=A0A1G7SED7_RHOCA|nr:hypothetical protein [Rhodobacter capsulatus]WER10178.1 hypothetical protein PUH89_04070 [Rhodobacter capsulatus]SDG21264.1 hypothetical protein SAMN04244550_03595 [Rhodobacter capsulatus]